MQNNGKPRRKKIKGGTRRKNRNPSRFAAAFFAVALVTMVLVPPPDLPVDARLCLPPDIFFVLALIPQEHVHIFTLMRHDPVEVLDEARQQPANVPPER